MANVELYRENGKDHRDVHLTVEETGKVHMSTYDLGESSRKTWGHDDYEFSVTVSATEVPNLLFALLKEKYSGRTNGTDDFARFCRNHNIKYEWVPLNLGMFQGAFKLRLRSDALAYLQ